jgi:hypothetical protein
MKIAFCVEFVFKFRQGGDSMADDWVLRRFAAFQDKQEAKEKRQRWDNKATASYDAMYHALAERVEKDVETYNGLFSAHGRCRANFVSDGSGFSVSCDELPMKVNATPTPPVIKLDWIKDRFSRPVKSATLEIVADDSGNVRYKAGQKLLADLSEASEIVLESVLCG